MSSAQTAAPPRPRGRTRITARALGRVAATVAAEAFGVTAGRLALQIDDAHGRLSIRVRTPLPVPALAQIRDEPRRVEDGGGSVLERAHRAQEEIRRRVQEITGSAVARVIVEITGADIRAQRRVQ